ncbi:GntR family transcriptional regulator [Bordetella pseudohinzii]|uniref:DNA-binding transcriptional repressor LldR n=1 Tax=Bordetella pseudohinzii TaxID=1331258 RepID=A0A0J6EYS0_9BORD|nr:GntR family transcriptional regulator [Bordetella pseudohinzii]ANY16754.1 GntR family transcriptional regulator [Bordetella pseudohinzii]KMM25495.1 GntR family transcriptional regulator [Bordetella pseudohinzii]KXA76279.1 GntR family transcriptional regulator [Bordetella pseudohinzii]KXA76818.1 GntR family transcriptional regulator [Bordetella pseudohinzii]CUI90572.1 DNA-binding transcriptional repressor LldR [Bordetella pseudohinzii]
MKPHTALAAQIIGLIQTEGLAPGSHLPAQWLADRLRVSRTPVNEALRGLAGQGLLVRQPNRGYFVAAPARQAEASAPPEPGDQAYFRIADDLLNGALPEAVTESQLRQRYQLTVAQLNAVLDRIAAEGWITRRPGYGWEFSSMMRTPDALLQSYRLRLALEPAALLEPGYRLDPAVLARCRQAELQLLQGGIETATADQLHARGVHFHESLVEASHNVFFVDAIRRVNRVRRLLSYRSMRDRKRYRDHCEQHLHILDLIEAQHLAAAAMALREHLQHTLRNIEAIAPLLRA